MNKPQNINTTILYNTQKYQQPMETKEYPCKWVKNSWTVKSVLGDPTPLREHDKQQQKSEATTASALQICPLPALFQCPSHRPPLPPSVNHSTTLSSQPLPSDHPLLLPSRPSSNLERRVNTEPSSAVVTSCMSVLLFLIITRERGHSTRKLIFHPRSIKTQSAARKQSEADRLLYSFNI